MPGKTNIEWTDFSWNPITGCTRVSPGCDNCYAFALHDKRHKAYLEGTNLPEQYAQPFTTVQLFPERLRLPFTWKKPRKIFVASMSDLLHKDVPDSHIRDLFRVMARVDRHVYQILTKRPSRLVNTSLTERILDDMQSVTGRRTWPRHIWLGVSVENQDYTWRIGALQRIPAPIRFLSCEPLLGPLDLSAHLVCCPSCGYPRSEYDGCGYCEEYPEVRGISWVIAGSESGPGARPAQVDWYRSLRDQCQDAGVAFFLKQFARNGHKIPLPELDGKVWNEFPSLADGEVHP